MRLRIHNKRQAKYYYALSSSDARRVKVIGILGLVSLIALAFGFYYFASQSILITVLCAPFFLVITLYHLINYWLMAMYPGFDTKRHRKRISAFMKADKLPRVAVFVPAAGEATDIVSQTIQGAKKINYPTFEVFVLDDSKDGIYKELAARLGARYMRRENVGQHKKAGNMNSAMTKISGFSHILVLDADFVPRREILRELMPYATPEVGIVQSPQHFELSDEVYRKSKIEFGAGMIQRNFYRITQVARNRFGGAICVGTNAIYNIAALKQVGGFEGVGRADWGHSEDVHTGLKIINARNKTGKQYRIEYVPIQLATGICPSDHLSFYKQQSRWATGSMQLIMSRLTAFSKTLRVRQRITYISNSLYYFYTMGLLFAPVQLLILLLAPATYDWGYTLLFMPMLFVTYILTPFLLRQHVEPAASSIVVISNAYTFVQALILLIVRRPLGWEATGAQSRAKKRHPQFRMMKIFSSLTFILVYVTTLAVLLLNYRLGFNPSTFIILVFLSSFIGHILYLHHTLAVDITFRRIYTSRHAYGYGLLALVIMFSSTAAFVYGKEYDMKFRPGSGIALIQDAAPLAPETNTNVGAVTAEPEPVIPQDVVVSVAPDDNQSEISSYVVNVISERRNLSPAAKGKLQDRLMHDMGYRNLIHTGSQYTFTQTRIDELISGSAYVNERESSFWSKYAARVGLE